MKLVDSSNHITDGYGLMALSTALNVNRGVNVPLIIEMYMNPDGFGGFSGPTLNFGGGSVAGKAKMKATFLNDKFTEKLFSGQTDISSYGIPHSKFVSLPTSEIVKKIKDAFKVVMPTKKLKVKK